MIGVDDRLVTPATMKWVKVGLTAGLATIPTTIILYYILGMAVDSAVEGSNMIRQWIFIVAGLVLLKAVLAWIFRTGQFRASSAAAGAPADTFLICSEPGAYLKPSGSVSINCSWVTVAELSEF
jgi:hypothetical protein